MTNIFVIGKTKSGKTTLCDMLNIENSNYVSASEWVKKLYVKDESMSQIEYVDDITNFSVSHLQKHPDVAVEYTKTLLNPNKVNIIDGIRNPNDFIKLYDPRKDIVIVVLPYEDSEYVTWFDAGVDTIVSYVNWLVICGITKIDLIPISYSRRIDREVSIKDIEEEICKIITT